MQDMLVKLYDLPDGAEWSVELPEGVQIRRAMAPDKFRILEWVREHSGKSAAGECDVCFSRKPLSQPEEKKLSDMPAMKPRH